MKLSEFQQELDDFLQDYETPYWEPHQILARITEEVGEVARIINCDYGPKNRKPGDEHDTLGAELADVMFAIACLANREGIDLESELAGALHKAKTRDKDRFPKKV